MVTEPSLIRRARLARKLTMARLGELADTSAQQIERLEKGKRPMTIEWAERLSPHLGLSPREIMFPDDSQSEAPTLPKDFNTLDEESKNYAIAQFLEELAGPAVAVEWLDVVRDIAEVARPRPDEDITQPNYDRIRTQAHGLAVAAKRKLRKDEGRQP